MKEKSEDAFYSKNKELKLSLSEVFLLELPDTYL